MWWESDLIKHFQRKYLLLASLICLQHFNFHGKCFFLKGKQNFLKLLEISCLQVRNSKLIIIIMLHILHSYMLVCVTTIVEVSFKIFFGVAVVLCWSLYPKKLLESLNFNFYLCKLGDLPGGGVEDHRMMFTGHLHLLQSYIQGIFYIC